MKRRHRVYFIVIIAVVMFCLCGCAQDENWTNFLETAVLEIVQTGELQVTEEVLAEQEESRLQEAEKEQEQAEAFERACETILEISTGEFIGYHPLDDTFLAWLASEYGRECVIQTAEEVKAGRQDTKIWYDLTGNTIHVLWLLYCRKTGVQQYQLEHVTWQDCASADEITLAFTGDINFAEGYVTTRHMDACANGIYDCFSEDLLSVMNDMDIMMVNNEFTYSTRGSALKGKAYTFRADPSRVSLLEAFGTDIVNLANNHVYDFGPDALLDTISTLDGAGIPHVGAGANLKEAEQPHYFVCNGRKIAIVAATQIERSLNYTKEATEDTPGGLKTLNAEKFVKVIQKAKKNSDHVIAVVHWGTEGDSNYGRDQYQLAKEFVLAGADAIVGGHTHCLQGFEIMDGVPIIYSLGNFWFSSGTLDTGLAKITISRTGELTMSFLPCIQQNLKTSLITEETEKQRVLDFMQSHSALGTSLTKEGILTQEQESGQ